MIDGMLNRIFLDPLLRGAYPADMLADTAWATDWSFVQDGDLAEISQPLDAIGVNYYQPDVVAAGDGPQLPYPTPGPGAWQPVRGPVTGMGWSIDPDGLHEMLVRITRDYGAIPLYVTENGAAFRRRGRPAGGCTTRTGSEYLRAHLEAAHRAIGRRGRRARLFRLVAARQLRVGVGLQQAVRARPRRLRHPGTDAEGQRLLVPRRDRRGRLLTVFLARRPGLPIKRRSATERRTGFPDDR